MVEEKLNVPLGGDFLRVVRDQERRCEESFDEWLPGAGLKAPQTMDALGTALSYLDRIASCWWGCRQDTHIEERLVGKAASNARAALHLLRSGYYDEALGLVRQIGETANLACLFVQSAESQQDSFGSLVKAAPLDFSCRDGLRRSKQGAGVLYNTYWVRFAVHVDNVGTVAGLGGDLVANPVLFEAGQCSYCHAVLSPSGGAVVGIVGAEGRN